MTPIAQLDDEALIRRLREAPPTEAAACRNELFTRAYPRVARWCVALCGDPDTAGDLAQDVVERVHIQLDSFRFESRFTTWLYTVTRRTALNRLQSERRHRRGRVDEAVAGEATDPAPSAADTLNDSAVGERIYAEMRERLEPLEAQVVYLHHVAGMTLPAITSLLALTNKSGAKAYLVAGMRKLRRHLGPWLERHAA